VSEGKNRVDRGGEANGYPSAAIELLSLVLQVRPSLAPRHNSASPAPHSWRAFTVLPGFIRVRGSQIVLNSGKPSTKLVAEHLRQELCPLLAVAVLTGERAAVHQIGRLVHEPDVAADACSRREVDVDEGARVAVERRCWDPAHSLQDSRGGSGVALELEPNVSLLVADRFPTLPWADISDAKVIQRLSARVTAAIFRCPTKREIVAVLHALWTDLAVMPGTCVGSIWKRLP
jgi:hypothetical protein